MQCKLLEDKGKLVSWVNFNVVSMVIQWGVEYVEEKIFQFYKEGFCDRMFYNLYCDRIHPACLCFMFFLDYMMLCMLVVCCVIVIL